MEQPQDQTKKRMKKQLNRSDVEEAQGAQKKQKAKRSADTEAQARSSASSSARSSVPRPRPKLPFRNAEVFTTDRMTEQEAGYRFPTCDIIHFFMLDGTPGTVHRSKWPEAWDELRNAEVFTTDRMPKEVALARFPTCDVIHFIQPDGTKMHINRPKHVTGLD